MPLYGQHVTPRQAMTHLTFSQIELSWTGGVCGYMGYMEIQGVWDMLYLDIVRWEGMRTGCGVMRRVA